MSKKILSVLLFLSISLCSMAVEITRYVSGTGTGDGMTPETPTSDLTGVLALGAKVDRLYIHITPGFYSIHVRDVGEGIIYSNIIIDGSWQDEGTSDMVRINYPGIEFVNSILYKISFSGNVTLSGGSLQQCDADKVITANLSKGDCYLYSCKAKGFAAMNYAHRSNSSLEMQDCKAKEGTYGLKGENIGTLSATDCDFSNQKEGGISINGCKKAYFENCSVSFNSGEGAVRLIEFDDSGKATFNKCTFLHNEVTYSRDYNFQIMSNAIFSDCLFVGNTEKNLDSKGIIHLSRPDFYFQNCTFLNNHGALQFEQFYPSRNQIVNCLFYGNGKTNIASGDMDVPLLNCAMDHGTGIPELDAQKGIMLLNESNKGFKFTGTDIEMEPSSALINAGNDRWITNSDIYFHPRKTFGGVDIGCTEFISSPGLWQPDSTFMITTDSGNYKLFKVFTDQNITYYGLFPEFMAEDGNLDITSYRTDFIYLDTMPVRPTVHEGKFIERHTVDSDGYLVDVVVPDSKGRWVSLDYSKYKNEKDRPTVKIVEGKVKFVKPQTPTTKKATPRKKSAPARKSGSKRAPARK